jgi:predicted TIM-barrel fold metal-dependent hydrolase
MVGRSVFGGLRWECIEPDAPDLLAQLEEAATLPGFVAFRLGLLSPGDLPFRGTGYERTLRFCTDRGIPVCSPCAHRPVVADSIAREFPELTLIVDQMALGAQPGQPEHAWRALPEVLALAARKNVHLKLTGLAALSTEGYPYTDLREPLLRILDAFGAGRCLWASDISMYRGQIGCRNRFPALVGPYPGKHTYAQSVGVLRDADWLDDDSRAHLLGATARRVLRWPHPR